MMTTMTNRNKPPKKGSQRPKTTSRPTGSKSSAVQMIYSDEKLLFYLRMHPEWYRVLGRHPEQYQTFNKIAKEELKLTTYHKIERFKNQVSLLGMLGEYMKRS